MKNHKPCCIKKLGKFTIWKVKEALPKTESKKLQKMERRCLYKIIKTEDKAQYKNGSKEITQNGKIETKQKRKLRVRSS